MSTTAPADGSHTSTPGLQVGPVVLPPLPGLEQVQVGSDLLAQLGPPSAAISSGPRSTLAIVDSLARLSLSPAAVARIFAPFPVAGPASYRGDDFLEPRITPAPHLHQGNDLVANQGTPIVASASGVVRLTSAGSGNDPDGGNSISLIAADGTRYYYAHLESFAPGLADGAKVLRGDIVGTVGMTGDATGPHLHFEIHPSGGAAVNPAPYLDRWLAQAASTAAALDGGPLSLSLPAGLSGSSFVSGSSHTSRAAHAPLGAQQWKDAAALRGVTHTGSLPILAFVLAALAWVVIRRQQYRVLGKALVLARARKIPLGVDPSDPLWSARKEVVARSHDTEAV